MDRPARPRLTRASFYDYDKQTDSLQIWAEIDFFGPALPSAFSRRRLAMCLLCAAVPATLALGAADQAHRRREEASLPPAGRQPFRMPISTRAALTVVALVVAAAVYHTRGLLG